MNSTNDTEHLQRSLIRDPTGNEIIHTKRINVSKINRREGLRSMISKAIRDVTIHRDIKEGKSETEDRLEHHWANPRDLVIERNTKPEKSHGAKDKSQQNGYETELSSIVSERRIPQVHRCRYFVEREICRDNRLWDQKRIRG